MGKTLSIHTDTQGLGHTCKFGD